MTTQPSDTENGYDVFLVEADSILHPLAAPTRSIQDAYDMASLFAGVPHVERIELFGSFARGEQTQFSDIDLIVCVDDYRATSWLNRLKRDSVRFDEEADFYFSAKTDRREAAYRVLDIGFKRMSLIEAISTVDVFVFPLNWRDRLEELQVQGNHSDPKFMQNIARDALVYTPLFSKMEK